MKTFSSDNVRQIVLDEIMQIADHQQLSDLKDQGYLTLRGIDDVEKRHNELVELKVLLIKLSEKTAQSICQLKEMIQVTKSEKVLSMIIDELIIMEQLNDKVGEKLLELCGKINECV